MITHQQTTLVRTHYQQSSTHQALSAAAKTQAEALLNKIFSSYCNVFKNVVHLIDQKLYLALGFQRPQDCLRYKTPSLSHAYIDRLVRATDTYLKLDPSLQYLDRITEATFRTLQDVRDEEALVVWQEVLRQNEQRRITPDQINKVMDELGVTTEYPNKAKVRPAINVAHQELLTQWVQQLCAALVQNVTTEEEWRQIAKSACQQLINAYRLERGVCV